TSAIAQVSQQKIGQNPLTINPNAALEIESSNKGLLLPRLELQATNLAAPLTAHVEGMTVYNTATAGTGETAVSPGYYYNDGTQWVRIATGDMLTADNGLTKTANNIQLGGNLTRNTIITNNGNDFTIATGGNEFNITGLDKTKVQATDATAGIIDHLLAVDANDKVKALKAAMPKFFYMPSIIVPTSEEQLNATGAGKVTGDAFNDATRQGTIQLHTRYAEQFGLTGTAQASSTGAPALPVLPADELHYYVTWYDINVFETVSVSNTGVLTYTVKSDADITIGSFMNIVFSVKED